MSDSLIKLEPLTKEDLELVRNWRNDPKIQKYMEYRQTITPEQQVVWFETQKKEESHYFIIEVNKKKIGLANIKNIDKGQRIGESGVFVYEDDLLNSLTPYAIVLKLLDFGFNNLNLIKIYCHILKSNPRAIRFNKSLGFRIAENQDNIENQLYWLEYDDYQRSTKAIRNILNKNNYL